MKDIESRDVNDREELAPGTAGEHIEGATVSKGPYLVGFTRAHRF